MITEIFVERKRLDINADISSLLTFAIDDVKNFATRQTTFSKTIVLPGTGNNNAIFGNIFELGQSNSHYPGIDNIGYNFNAAKSARCIIFQDNLQTFKGTLRLLEIDIYRGQLEYEVALNGDLTTLNVALSSGLLTDLDFSAYDVVFDAANIISSWDNPGGSGIYFPLIDYGSYSVGKHNWEIRTFRPALYAKEYIDKMFTAAGFRYESALFDTPRFKSLIIPHNQKAQLKSTINLVNAVITSGGTVMDNPTLLAEIPFDSEVLSNFTRVGNAYKYTGVNTITVSLTLAIDGNYYSDLQDLEMGIYKNGVKISNAGTLPNTAGVILTPYTAGGGVDFIIATNDEILIQIESPGSGTYHVETVDALLTINALIPQLAQIAVGDTIEIKYSVPQNIRQIDFLMGFVHLFNLYVYEDPFDERLIHISPFVDFYSTDSGNADDWTYKLNRNEAIKIKPMSELTSKVYNFNYKDDGDYWNDLYKKRYNQSYGSYSFDSQFEFTSQTNKLELPFAPTPLVGIAGIDKVYPTIYKRSGTTEETIDSVIRIMQTKKITGVTSWDIMNGPADTGTVLSSNTSYGYAGHLDDPDAPSNDLNFGVLSELFFTLVAGDLTKTQFNVYWSSYMAEITDKNSKLMTAKFHLTPADIFNLSFSKYKYVDGVLFRLNKITDYNATIPSDCEVQLLKVINTIY